MDSISLAEEFRNAGVTAVSHDSFEDAVSAALTEAMVTSSPVIGLGSLYMYADFAAALRNMTTQK
jgi:hypothetical protein